MPLEGTPQHASCFGSSYTASPVLAQLEASSHGGTTNTLVWCRKKLSDKGGATMPNIIHFEIGVDDLEAAASFYSKVFGWEIVKAEDNSGYWFITTGDDSDPGITGALTSRYDELNPTINTIDVPSLDSFAKKITEAGGKVLAPKISVPGMGYVQYCQDLEGNTFGIMEFDESAP
jgi:predicted enzyme related to lactoylglutathione lyase